MARTIGAIGRGFVDFDPDVHIAGVICNRVGSRSHLRLLREALTQPPVLGAMPKNNDSSFPERHLGLRTADESAVPEATLVSWGELVRDWCELDSIVSIARQAPPLTTSQPDRPLDKPPAARSESPSTKLFISTMRTTFEDSRTLAQSWSIFLPFTTSTCR